MSSANDKKDAKEKEQISKKKLGGRLKRKGKLLDDINEKKAYTFLEAIDKYALEQREKMKNDAEKVKEQEMKKAESEVLSEVNSIMEIQTAKMKAELVSQISEKQISCRRSLLKNRDLISEEVFSKVRAKLENFTKTQEYVHLLLNFARNVSDVLTQEGTIIYIRDLDRDLTKEISSLFSTEGCRVEIDKNIKIGGLRGYNEKMGIVIDETLDSRLELQYDWFKENSGLSIV